MHKQTLSGHWQIYGLLMAGLMGLLMTSGVEVQAFDLFDQSRGQEPAPKTPPPQPAPQQTKKTPPKPPTPKKPKKAPKQEDFTLQGISRFGKQYYVSLRTPDKKDLSLSWTAGKPLPIEGYQGYFLNAVHGREVEIKYPKDAPCREHRQGAGVLCKSAQVAVVSLLRGKPQAAKKTGNAVNQKAQANKKKVADARRNFMNKAQKDTAKKTIKPEDVPEGMKVVRTPFGDRLVKR